MLQAIELAGEAKWFKPHPFAQDYLNMLCGADIRDLHYVLTLDGEVVGYGLLRGWDEGYDVPSLGIGVHPRLRGMRFGLMLMEFLHCAARARGSDRVRLRVAADNDAAISLYRRMGYAIGEAEDGPPTNGLLVGTKEL
jgi:ribosomal protein S18 acetylase RimI-like enzyme